MHPKDISINHYTYDLPENKIAKYPLQERDASKLLIYTMDGTIQEDTYHHIAAHIPENSFLVFNNTKVVEARILFKKSTGSTIQIFCLEPDDGYQDITSAMLQTGNVYWKCLVGGAKKWKDEILNYSFEIDDQTVTLYAKKITKKDDHFLVHLYWDDDTLSFAEVLHHAGILPLPPYLNRATEQSDTERYQTIYAKYDGSVAAPTAGLHFTEKVLDSLEKNNCTLDYVTLHVGAGTFKPVKSESMKDHTMHYETMEVSISFLEKLLHALENNKKIITVGTTSTRTIESLYWLGVEAQKNNLNKDLIELQQWIPYDSPSDIAATSSISALINYLKKNHSQKLFAKTQIIIAPGYHPKIVNALITNFHQPQSTLILLVAALIGDDWKKMYHYALEHNFRFLSYGDGSLLWCKNPS